MTNNPNQSFGVSPQVAVPTPPKTKNRKNLLIIIVVVVLSAGAIAGAVVWGMQQNKQAKQSRQQVNDLEAQKKTLENKAKALQTEVDKRKATTGEDKIDKNGFQSVFLTGGQVYFGKITDISETQITLTDIYYLTAGNGPNDQKLVKLGNELHGPKDVMYIERKNVEFWENLKPDSEVSKAIVAYEKSH